MEEKKEKGNGELLLQLFYALGLLGGILYMIQIVSLGVWAMWLGLFN
jgi:hypothetical protein